MPVIFPDDFKFNHMPFPNDKRGSVCYNHYYQIADLAFMYSVNECSWLAHHLGGSNGQWDKIIFDSQYDADDKEWDEEHHQHAVRLPVVVKRLKVLYAELYGVKV